MQIFAGTDADLQVFECAIWFEVDEGLLYLLLQDGRDRRLPCILQQAQRLFQVCRAECNFLQTQRPWWLKLLI